MCQAVKKKKNDPMPLANHILASGPFPHRGGCSGCQNLHVCSVCGHPAPAETRCTNGRCLDCHVAVCTPGGAVSSGHGFGSQEAARARAIEVRIRDQAAAASIPQIELRAYQVTAVKTVLDKLK